jgi:FKBP-type peptidyl-prolyl cis-trans isomerase FkpA
MAKPHERAFALMGAILFFVTASALTIGVIWQSSQHKDTPAATTTIPANKLQGTKLAHFNPVTTVPKLQIEDNKVGTGAVVQSGSAVSVDYTGALAATGVIFQSSLDTGKPVSLSLSQVIPGWQEGIPGMKVGGVRRLLIPAAQAYGAQAQDGIPANSDLVFDITLHGITK